VSYLYFILFTAAAAVVVVVGGTVTGDEDIFSAGRQGYAKLLYVVEKSPVVTTAGF
jgi:hypothetical protein